MEKEGAQPKVRRRIQLTSTAQWQAATIGIVSGMALVGIGLRPTGSAPFDLAVLAAAGGFVVWGACTAPWWMLVVASAVATAINPLGAGTIVGLAGIALSAWVGVQRRSRPLERAVAAGLIMVSFSFVGHLFRLGVPTAIGVFLMLALTVAGLRRRPRSDRRLARRIVGGAFAFALVVLAIAGFSAYAARNNLRSANQHASAGLAAMRGAEFNTAATEFESAAEQFDQADRKLAAPWMQPIRFIPIAAQQWRAADLITGTAANASLVVSTNASSVDLDRLKIDHGQIDLKAVADLESPLKEVRLALTDLSSAVSESASVWLAPPIAKRLDELNQDIDAQQRLGDKALEAVELAPDLLGANGRRRYFVMFTTPAEARGQGGFMGNYGEITATEGRIEVTEFGRTADLIDSMENPVVLQNAPQDWMATWGTFGFRIGDDDHVARDAWSIINISAQFPNTAQVVSELYPESGGRELDGVFSIDVYGVEALIDLAGPIQVDNSPVLTGENTAQFLLFDQYLGLSGQSASENNAERVDMLGVIAEETINRLLTTNPPEPLAFGRRLAPLVAEGRVVGWSRDTREEALFSSIKLDGARLSTESAKIAESDQTGVQVVINNGLGNKIDSFLRRKTVVDGENVTISYTNTAPKSGLPRYIIGTRIDNPPPEGTNRMIVTIYSTAPISDLTAGGAPIVAPTQNESGLNMLSFQVDVAPADTVDISFRVAGNSPFIVDQPLAIAPESVDGDK